MKLDFSWILVRKKLDFSCNDVGFQFEWSWILVGMKLDFSWNDVGFQFEWSWILVGMMLDFSWILVRMKLDFSCNDVCKVKLFNLNLFHRLNFFILEFNSIKLVIVGF